MRVHSVIIMALTRNEGTVKDEICGMQEGFPVKASCVSPRQSAGGSSTQS